MRADGWTCRQRQTTFVTLGLGDMERCEDGCRRTRCGNQGCDGHQEAIQIISPSWVARSFRITLLSKGNVGNMYIDCPCQSCDRARGRRIGDINLGRWVWWTVTNMSTAGVPMSQRFEPLSRGGVSTLSFLADLAKTGCLLSHSDKPRMCLALRTMS